MMLFDEAVEQRLFGCSSDLLQRDGPDASQSAAPWHHVDQNRLRFVSLYKRIERRLTSRGQFDLACAVQHQQKTTADHIAERPVGLFPLPCFAQLSR